MLPTWFKRLFGIKPYHEEMADDVNAKTITALSGEEKIVKAVFGDNASFGKPKGMATIVQDDPLDIFPSETNEEEPNDKTS